MLVLPIKKKWYEMILSGEKKEEYREIKPYYMVRFTKLFDVLNGSYGIPTGKDRHWIIFRNGYSGSSPWFKAECSLRIGEGKLEWGAETGKEYYILEIHNISFD